MTITTKIKSRIDIKENWERFDPVLLSGEIGFEKDTIVDMNTKMKIGDGVSPYTSLPYLKVDGMDVAIGNNRLLDLLGNIDIYDTPSLSTSLSNYMDSPLSSDYRNLATTGYVDDAVSGMLNVIPLTDGTETLSSLNERISVYEQDGLYPIFDVSDINTDPRLKLVSFNIDVAEGTVRLQDIVTGRIYIGGYIQTETVSEVISKSVEAYTTIIVTATTRDSVTVMNQTVSLYEGSSATGTPRETATYNGQPVSFVVPYGFHYFVSITSNIPNHFSPTTASGIANTVTNVTLTYQDTANITDFEGMKSAVSTIYDSTYADAIGAGQTPENASATALSTVQHALVGKEIEDTWVADDGVTSYSDPMMCVDVKWYEGEDGEQHLGAKMQRKYASANSIVFDSANREVSDELSAEDGIYYYGWGIKYDPTMTYIVGDICEYNDLVYKCTIEITTPEPFDVTKWTSQDPNSINAQGLITLSVPQWSSSTVFNVGEECSYNGEVYRCLVKTTANSAWNPTQWRNMGTAPVVTGNPIPYTSFYRIFRNIYFDRTKGILLYGHNRYKDSTWRQYLIADPSVGKGLWWSRGHIGQVSPSIANIRPYQAGCSEALLNAARKVKISCYTNSITDGSIVDEFYDKFWLPSGTELYGSVNANEGTADKYWIDATGYTAPNNSANAGRIIYSLKNHSSAVGVRLRSAGRGYSGYAWYVNTTGYLYNYYANYAYQAVPACVIY